MTKEEIWERLEIEFKLRGYSQKSIGTYKAGITTFLDWANKPYEDLDEEDFLDDSDEEESDDDDSDDDDGNGQNPKSSVPLDLSDF